MTTHDDYWGRLDDELDDVPMTVTIDPMPHRSTDRSAFHSIELASVGHAGSGRHRIGGYLSVPTTPGPHPAVLEVPRYGSANHSTHVNERSRYLVLTLLHRGRAGSPHPAEYPGPLTERIASPEEYAMRGVVADCLRGAEYLASRADVDPTRIGVLGEDLAILVAARRPVFNAVRMDHLLLTDAWRRAHGTRSYPVAGIVDAIHHRPGDAAAIESTLALFDTAAHAPDVRAKTLVCASEADAGSIAPLLAGLGTRSEHFVLSFQDRYDADAKDGWLAGRLGVPAMSRFLAAPSPLPGEAVA